MYFCRIFCTLIYVHLNLFLLTLFHDRESLALVCHHLFSWKLKEILLISSIYFSSARQSSYVSIHSGGSEVIVLAVYSDFYYFTVTKGLRTDDSSYDSYFSPIMFYFENLIY